MQAARLHTLHPPPPPPPPRPAPSHPPPAPVSAVFHFQSNQNGLNDPEDG